MKKILTVILTFSFSAMVFAQEKLGTDLIGTLSQQVFQLKNGDTLLINIPVAGQRDYMFITKKKGWFNSTLIGSVAEIVGTGAMAIGMSSNNMDVMLGAIEVADKATAVSYGTDAINQIGALNISKQAKKIAGKKAIVINWKKTDEDYIVNVKIEKKKYQINYIPAVLTHEINVNIE